MHQSSQTPWHSGLEQPCPLRLQAQQDTPINSQDRPVPLDRSVKITKTGGQRGSVYSVFPFAAGVVNQLSLISALTGLGSLTQEQLAVLNNPAILQQAVSLSKGLQPGGMEGWVWGRGGGGGMVVSFGGDKEVLGAKW